MNLHHPATPPNRRPSSFREFAAFLGLPWLDRLLARWEEGEPVAHRVTPEDSTHNIPETPKEES